MAPDFGEATVARLTDGFRQCGRGRTRCRKCLTNVQCFGRVRRVCCVCVCVCASVCTSYCCAVAHLNDHGGVPSESAAALECVSHWRPIMREKLHKLDVRCGPSHHYGSCLIARRLCG